MDKKQIVYKKVDELVPYENNPRKNEEAVKYVANSIREFNFQNPIIVDKDNVIIAGHTRLEAAKELGLKEVPVIVADELTPEQVKALRIADNKTAEIAMWDTDKLSLELEDIGFDMTDFGFGELELSILTNEEKIDWNDVQDLSENNYEEPEHDMLECPSCHHIDRKIHFKKVEK